MADDKRAPLLGCKCAICRVLWRRQPYVPVVISRDPYHGVLTRGDQQTLPKADS